MVLRGHKSKVHSSLTMGVYSYMQHIWNKKQSDVIDSVSGSAPGSIDTCTVLCASRAHQGPIKQDVLDTNASRDTSFIVSGCDEVAENDLFPRVSLMASPELLVSTT